MMGSQALGHLLSLPFQAQRKAASSGSFLDLLGLSWGSPWVPGPASEPGWESEDEGAACPGGS